MEPLSKKIVFLNMLFVLLPYLNNYCQNYFYYHDGEQIHFTVSTKRIFVKYVEDYSIDQKLALLDSIPNIDFNSPGLDFIPNASVLELRRDISYQDVFGIFNALKEKQGIYTAQPFLVYEGNDNQGLTDEFIVRLNSLADRESLFRIVDSNNVSIVKQSEFDSAVFVLSVGKTHVYNAIEMANLFLTTYAIFQFSQPNFIRYNALDSADPHFNDQWGLLNNGQYGGAPDADIDADEAWQITKGRPEIAVAVLDTGVDLLHPDLQGNLLPGYDATGQGSNGAPSGNEAHGTACAGIIAAKGDNQIGISGVAPLCKIIPVRIFSNNLTTDSWIADAINWARWNDADILSNSWNFSTPSSIIQVAIQNAAINGRGGLGCLLVFSSGNDNSNSIPFPKYLPEVLCVGATSMCNQRKDEYSCDGEKWGSNGKAGSNYGAALDLVAPGVKIATLDISGPAGFSNSGEHNAYDDDYIAQFRGTSAACPFVAGVCALVLSVNRCLTGPEAKQIVELSCEKVGIYCYNRNVPGHPVSTWNHEMGYGLVNAFSAVKYAFSSKVSSYWVGGGGFAGTVGPYVLTFIQNGCPGVAAGSYLVKRYELNASFSFPYTSKPVIAGYTNGLSGANPNSGNGYFDVINLSETSATLRTYAYEVKSLYGQTLGWIPGPPSTINYNVSVLESVAQNEYLQNKTVLGKEIHACMDFIKAGYSVTNTVPYGNYILAGSADVTLHAGNQVVLEPGFITQNGAVLNAYVAPFFTCPQFPLGVIDAEK